MGLLVTLVMKYLPLVLGFLIGKTIIKLVLRRWELQKIFKAFSGPKPHFLWGNTKELFGDYQGLVRMAELAHVYSGAYPAWTGPADAQLVIVTSGTTRAVLAGADPKDEFSNSLLGPWIGDGLLLSHGKKWERTRRLLTPAFHSDNLKNYIKTFEECSKELVKKWQHSTEPEEVFQHVSLLTLDIIMQCLFGFHSNCQSGSVLHPYIQGVYDVSELVAKRVVNPLYHYKFIYKLSGNGKRFQAACDAIHEHSERIIRERRSLIASEKPGTRNMDFLDVLLTAKDRDDVSLSDKEIRDEVNTFIFEGHESTASTITWFLYNMAKHPEYQNKCREEILEVIGKDKEITWSWVHRDPEVWENPHEYDPERFHPDKRVSSLIHMPFSTGPRKCIGMQFALTQVKVVACEILRNFHIDLDPPHEATPESILFLRSKSGVYLKFIKLPVEGVPIL
ncbi:CP4A4-like protein [Mya arenaria]|uniref:CP4A4-like protein n=1 Tax=Mya arenaria TaxID=6604 RepID=A0ABY7FC39_MYAAR|nr:CP4A4-like protein [Mya arenaria]